MSDGEVVAYVDERVCLQEVLGSGEGTWEVISDIANNREGGVRTESEFDDESLQVREVAVRLG